MKEVIEFLKLNGFIYEYDLVHNFTNSKCHIQIKQIEGSINWYYEIKTQNKDKEYIYQTINLNMYHLIGYLTYYGLMDKNYKQL